MLEYQRILDVVRLVEVMTLSSVKLVVNRHRRRILGDLVQEALGHLNGNNAVGFTVQHLRKQ